MIDGIIPYDLSNIFAVYIASVNFKKFKQDIKNDAPLKSADFDLIKEIGNKGLGSVLNELGITRQSFVDSMNIEMEESRILATIYFLQEFIKNNHQNLNNN